MYLFFDTETTGLPRNWNAPVHNIQNWPRMVQIAWLLYNDDGQKLDSKDFIIKPEGYTIPKNAVNIHNISTERAIKDGDDLSSILLQFAEQIERAAVIVAHNINFDEKIVGAEFIRKNIPHKLFQKKRICTMKESKDYCRIPGRYGYKWPNLSELHMKLFGSDFEEAHNASVDIEITSKCFWKMKELEII